MSDWVAFLTETVIEAVYEEDENGVSEDHVVSRQVLQGM
jgi:hypothetical protein